MDENSGDERIERYLKALIHPTRRKIIRLLAERGKLSYSEMMRLTGLDDSGTFAFHLRNLQGLVEKGEDGDYRLTEDGWKAHRALEQLDSVERAPLKQDVEVEKKPARRVVTISDRLHLEIDEVLLGRLKERGEKLLITDVVTVVFKKVDPKLVDEVLEGITDCMVVYVPEDLYSILQIKADDVLSIKTYRGEPPKTAAPSIMGALASSIGTIISTVTSGILGGILGSLPQARGPLRKLELEEEVETPCELNVISRAGRVEVKSTEGSTARALVETRRPERVELRSEGRVVTAKVEEGNMRLEVPRRIESINAAASAGKMTLHVEGADLKRLNAETSAGSMEVKLHNLASSSIYLKVDAGSLRGTISYGRYEGESRLELESNAGTLALNVEVEEDVAVDVDLKSQGGVALVEVNGFKGQKYRDPNYQVARARLSIVGSASAGALKVNVRRKPVAG